MTNCEAGKCLKITNCSQWHLPPFSHALLLFFPSFLPPPLFLLTPLTRVESYQTKWHLRDWLGSFSQLCLEMVECLSCLVGSCWQLLPPIGLWAGFANMMSWFLEEVTHMINFLKVHHRCARPSLCLFFLSVFDNFHVSLLFISTKKNVE